MLMDRFIIVIFTKNKMFLLLQMIKMMIIVVVVFVFCWLPINIFQVSQFALLCLHHQNTIPHIK